MVAPYHLGKIATLESVQRRFTMRLVGLHNMNYADIIDFLKLDSLQERRLRFDIIFAYKIYTYGIVLPRVTVILKRSNLLNRVYLRKAYFN